MSHAISGLDAWTSIIGVPHAAWDGSRFASDVLPIEHTPKFRFSASDTVFCMGSCFARNVEEHLIYNGIEVVSKRIVSPFAEWPNRANGIANKFTTHSMLNEIEWLVDRPEIDVTWFEGDGDTWRDLNLTPGSKPVTLERAIERRKYLSKEYFSRVASADVIVLTLGLNEVWQDTTTGGYLNTGPSLASIKREAGRYSLCITDAAENHDVLERLYSLVKRLNPGCRIIVTVSPVALQHTFSGQDIVAANTHSKSVLRCAAQAFATGHDDVDYFPSFEMVMFSGRGQAYFDDQSHPDDKLVGAVIARFLQLYTGLEPVDVDFSEISYLGANPDVDEAVRRGELGSGYEHWIRHGQTEGRALKPAVPTELMLHAGVVRPANASPP